MPTLTQDIELLGHTRSPKRRAAAKRLRKRGDVAAGPHLLAALRREIEDPRTWETQYQLVMALGECQYKEAIEFLSEFAAKPLDTTMIYIGLGDALVRLRVQSLEDGAPVLELMTSHNRMLVDGAFRAMAMLRMVPSNEQIDQILHTVSAKSIDDSIRIWPLAAAPGWSGDRVQRFIDECLTSSVNQIVEAAELAANKRYRKWSPL